MAAPYLSFMPEAPYRLQPQLPRPPMTSRQRTQIEAFLVLRRNPLELWGKAAYESDVLPGKFLGRPQIMLNAPDAIRHVLVTNQENYGRAVATRRVLEPLLGDGLVMAQGDSWRHQRRTLAPSFAPRTMPILARHVVRASEEAEAELDRLAGRPVELLPAMQRLALAIAARSMFSLEADSFAGELRALLLRYGLNYGRVGLFDLLLPLSVPSPLDVGRAAFRRDWLRFMDRVIEARQKQAAPDADRPRDLLDLLTAARDPETGAGFDRALLRDEVATMIIAGHETTSVALFWACYIAAKLPEHQARIAEEGGAADLSAESAATSLRALPYTRAFIDETLRLYPPAFLLTRRALGADVIAGRKVAPGTVISIAPWVLHRHRRLWNDPQHFDPGRFLPGAPSHDRYAYLPFGAGPRICVGAQFALTEATLVLARLLRAFRVQLVGGEAVIPRGIVTTQPDRPVRFVLTRRPGRDLHR
jgi:cytochrome P450